MDAAWEVMQSETDPNQRNKMELYQLLSNFRVNASLYPTRLLLLDSAASCQAEFTEFETEFESRFGTINGTS